MQDENQNMSRREAVTATGGLGVLAALLVGSSEATAQEKAGKDDKRASSNDQIFNPTDKPLSTVTVRPTAQSAKAGELLVQWGTAQKNAVWITIDFPANFSDASPISVVTQSYWAGQNNQVGHIDTIDTVSRSSFRIGSSNLALNYYVMWIAIGRAA